MKHHWKFVAMPNGILNNTQAETVGRELVKLERANGAVKPADVVAAAEPITSPLHPLFTWDDTAAAQAYREDEARNIIRSVRIICTDIPAAEQPVIRAHVNVKAHDTEKEFEGNAYISMTRATEDDAYRQQMLTNARSEIVSWQRRYDDLLQFTGKASQIKEVVESLDEEITKEKRKRKA